MDSSHSKEVTEEGFTPWQIGRLRDRLTNYKGALRHGWERIATDILYEEELPVEYVDSEDVRPLSESLRRLVNGSQVPSSQRLTALKVFLISQGYLDANDLEDANIKLKAPMAFSDYITADNETYRQIISGLKVFDGTFSLVEESADQVLHKLLTLKFQNGFFLVKYQETFLNKIDSLNRLTNVPSVRRRALTREDKYEGWSACGPSGQIVIFTNEMAFAQHPKFFLIWAEQERDEITQPAESIILMPYEKMHGAEDLAETHSLLESGSAASSESLFQKLIYPGFEIFTRSEGRTV